jgi:hypothetical protein
MRKLNDGLDINNPAHQYVIELNNRNEKLYGEYHSECGCFARFCVCTGDKNIRKNYEQTR